MISVTVGLLLSVSIHTKIIRYTPKRGVQLPLQHNVSQRLKEYLLLIRLPNVFTTPSNILTGYFTAVTVAKADSVHLFALMVSSGLLYVAGIVLNDYFDIEIDKRERPSRPLPSGNISKGLLWPLP